MSSQFFMNQAVRNMAPILSESNRFELIGTVTSLFWLLAGLFSDPYLYFISMVLTIAIGIYLGLLGMLSRTYYYDLHAASFRRLIVGGLAHWAYTSGRSQGPVSIELGSLFLPIMIISQSILALLLLTWFSSKYIEQIRDPNVPRKTYPLLIIRGIFRGLILFGLILAIFGSQTIQQQLTSFVRQVSGDSGISLSWFNLVFLVIYIAEPLVYGLSQMMNKTLSRFELTMGNARLPSVALRESFLANTLLLILTMLFGGVEGGLWALLRAFYLVGLFIVFFYSIDAIKQFQEQPLGTHAISDFLQNTPDKMDQLNLAESFGHVIGAETQLQLNKHSSLNLQDGSILIPIDETKDKVNALVIGKGQSVLDTGKQKIGEKIDGISTVLIPVKEFRQVSEQFVATKLSQIDLSSLELPSLVELQKHMLKLSANMGGFVDKIINQLNSINLSNYGITEEKDRTEVHLPGIYVHETPELTNVNVAGLRVIDGKKATTVRFGSTLTVVELPKANFVSLPGITVLEISGIGSAVNIFGLPISDGLPADKLAEFRDLLLKQLDRWELGIDAELGRFLADKSATGLLNMSWDGEFNTLLDSSNKTLGTHEALQLPGKSDKMHYLPPNFDEDVDRGDADDERFIELTGVTPSLPKASAEGNLIKNLDRNEDRKDQQRKEDNRESSSFSNIYDVEIEEDD